MTSSVRPALWPGLLAVLLVVGLVLVSSAAVRGDGEPAAGPSPKVLTVCAVPSAMPRTGKTPDGTPQGLDVAVALLLGRGLKRPIEFHWCASAECGWSCLPEGRCDLVVGQPHGSGPARGVAWSVPYAGAQFGLVVPRDAEGVRTLADLRGKRVGVVAGTVPLSEKDHKVVRFRTREELLDGFQGAGLDAAFGDADFAAWYLHEHPRLSLKLVPGFVPREHWNMAVAVRAGDAALLTEINRALGPLSGSTELQKVYNDLGVTLRSPFTGDARPEVRPDTWGRVAERKEIVVSIDPANLPYSSAKDDRPGVDVELARALAERLHVKLRIEWLDTAHESAVGELLQHRCDLVFGEAVDANAVADDEELAGKVIYSRPYYGTGYVLVRRKDGPRVKSLAELKGARSQRLGTEAGSVADYRLRQSGYLRRLYRNQLATLKALNDGDIDFAYLWANVGWTLHASPDFKLEIIPADAPEDRWDVAVAMCKGDDELKRHVDEALGALIADGTVARALARYHLPSIATAPPQAGTAAAGVIRHAVADRGPEPRMERVQKSKAGYSGMARVRSAGELVVGLDQNNLPSSTAHPAPAGLDHEIAALLAERLGVSLRVYWAYSSHDSYPSKLATKQLCDVILGVTPDDRFANRVLYSRPYYAAAYQMVVRSGEGPPAKGATVAVEEGVAVRGLKGRPVSVYPSTEAVLEAVATGREGAGYVISSRGAWLARNRWEGRLTFLPASRSVDSFPICAAIRKADSDLKDAIDRAWDELEQSGRLAPIFARWHVPFDPARSADSRTEP